MKKTITIDSEQRSRHAVVDSNYNVINIIEYDPAGNWQPPAGCFVIKSSYANIGDDYDPDQKIFINPSLRE